MSLMQWKNDSLFDHFYFADLDDMFKSVTNLFRVETGIKVKNNKDNYEIIFEVPGFDKNEIKVNENNNVLNVSASKENKEHSKSVMRSIYLGKNVDLDNIKSSLKNGLLTVIVPKKDNTKSIPVE